MRIAATPAGSRNDRIKPVIPRAEGPWESVLLRRTACWRSNQLFSCPRFVFGKMEPIKLALDDPYDLLFKPFDVYLSP